MSGVNGGINSITGTSTMSTGFQSPDPTSTAPVTETETQLESSSTDESFGTSDQDLNSTSDGSITAQQGIGSTINTDSEVSISNDASSEADTGGSGNADDDISSDVNTGNSEAGSSNETASGILNNIF